MSAAALDTIPFISVQKGGVTRFLPVQLIQRRGQPDRPVPVSRNPKTGYPQPVSIGSDPAARRNYDIDEVIFADWSGGMGADTYPPQAAPTSFQWSQCETRYSGVLACRPLPTALAATTGLLGARGIRALETGLTNASPLCWAIATKCYRYTGSALTAVQSGGVDISTVQSVVRGMSGVFLANGTNVYRATDGIAYTAMALGAMTGPQKLAFFDEKVWCLDVVASTGYSTATVYSSADLMTAAGGGGTWTAGNLFRYQNTGTLPEYPVKLLTWTDPNDSNRTTLWCLTTRRLLYYDYYAQTPAWVTWFQARQTGGGYAFTDSEVWGRNQNLYAAWMQDFLWEFTGRTIDNPAPNALGGLPQGTQLRPHILGSNGHHLFAFGTYSDSDFTSFGATVAMTEAKAFHHILNGQFIVVGGGVGEGKVWTLAESSTVTLYEQTVPDDSAIPQHAAGRTYDSATLFHKSAWLHCGFRNVWKNLRYLELDCIADSGDPGLNTGATVLVQVRTRHRSAVDQLNGLINGSTTSVVVDTGATFAAGDLILVDGELMYVTGKATNTLTVTRGWASLPSTATSHNDNTPVYVVGKTLGTLTDASTFPAVATLTGGIDFKECQIWLALTRGTATSATPLIRAVKVGYRPRPKQRFTCGVSVDVRDNAPAFAAPDGLWRGYSASSYRVWLDELGDNDDSGLPDALVTLAYGGEGNTLHPRYRSIPDCEVLVSAQEDPEHGDGLYLVQFNDVSPPASG